MAPFVLLLAAAVPGGSSRTPKADCEELIKTVLPFAQLMLRQTRAFLPFGATMSASGVVGQVGAWTGDDDSSPDDLVKLLETQFREGARHGEYRATALVMDVLTVPPGKSVKQDAIAVRLDHRDHYSVQVIFPYSFDGSGKLQVEEPFTTKGEDGIFAR